MANIFNAITTGAGGISTTGDSSGTFSFQKDGVAKATLDGSGTLTATSFVGSGASLTGLPSPAGGATNSGLTSSNYTLTSSSNKVQLSAVNTTSNINYTLPDATTISTKGGPIFSLQPQGVNGVYVKNNSGNIIGYGLGSSGTAFFTGQTKGADISLIDNSTANGLWSINNIASIADFTPPTQYAAAVTQYGASLSAISTSSWLIMYKNSSNNTWYAIVGSKSGSTITYGTAVQLSASTTIGSGDGSNVIALSSTAAICLLAGTTNITAIPLVLSGSSITVGSSSTFGSAVSSVAYAMSACKVTSTTLAVRANNTTNLNSYGVYMIQHNGSSAPTIGTPVTQTTRTGYASTGSIAFINSTTLFDVYPAVTTGNMNARTISISGTTLTNNTATQISTISDFGGCVGITLNGTRALVARTYDTQGAYREVTSINISGTSVSFNTDNIAVQSLYGYQVGNGVYSGPCGCPIPFYIDSTGSSGYVQLNYPSSRSQSCAWVKATADATTGVLVPSTPKVTLTTLSYGTNYYTNSNAPGYCWLTDGNTFVTTGLSEYYTSSWGNGPNNYTITLAPNSLWL
jgi:hypothetical protein